jgi:predicted deacylase
MMGHRVTVEAFHPHTLEFYTFGEPDARPHVLITAGIHGGEATGIYAAKRLAEWLEGQPLQGRVTVLPVANPAAFRRGTRTNPYDEVDMNRIFPGRADGEPTQRTARAIWEVAETADYIVDLHCCGLFGSDYTLALWQEFPACRELAAKLDIPVVIQSGGTRAQLFVEASHAGTPAVIIELAGGQLGSEGGIVNLESGGRAFTAVSNLLKRLGVAEGEAPAFTPAFYGKLAEVSAPRDGLWAPALRPGSKVDAGQVLGTLDGVELRSPVTGAAISVRADCFAFPGQMVVMVAPQAEA